MRRAAAPRRTATNAAAAIPAIASAAPNSPMTQAVRPVSPVRGSKTEWIQRLWLAGDGRRPDASGEQKRVMPERPDRAGREGDARERQPAGELGHEEAAPADLIAEGR